MIKKNTGYYLLAVGIGMLSQHAAAKEISYSYVQGSYISASANDLDSKGFGIAGSFSIAPNIALTASASKERLDVPSNIDVDVNNLAIGVTVHTSVAPKTDLFGNFSVINVEGVASNGVVSLGVDDTGNNISIGARHLVADSVELDLAVTRTDVFDRAFNAMSAGARLYVNDRASLGLSYVKGEEDENTLFVSARIDLKQETN